MIFNIEFTCSLLNYELGTSGPQYNCSNGNGRPTGKATTRWIKRNKEKQPAIPCFWQHLHHCCLTTKSAKLLMRISRKPDSVNFLIFQVIFFVNDDVIKHQKLFINFWSSKIIFVIKKYLSCLRACAKK